MGWVIWAFGFRSLVHNQPIFCLGTWSKAEWLDQNAWQRQLLTLWQLGSEERDMVLLFPSRACPM